MTSKIPAARLSSSCTVEQYQAHVELGWEDLDEGRLSDFDPADIKKRGRERLALTNGAQLAVAQRQR
jgi:hypothetical protein